MQPYQGGDTLGLEADSTAPPQPVVQSRPEPISGSLPPLEIVEVSSEFPAQPDFTPRRSEHVVMASAMAQPLALATDSDGPKLATIIEMQRFIERVRGLRAMNPRPSEELLATFEQGLDVYNRTERTRLAFGLTSPVARAENIFELAERASKSLQAVATGAAMIYHKPAQELAAAFMAHVAKLLESRSVTLQDPYVFGMLAGVAEEAYYTMILDSTHLSRVDMERLYGAGEAKKLGEPEAQEKRKLTPAEKRAKMGLAPRKGEQVEAAAEEPLAEPESEPEIEEAVEGEYEKELVAEARTGFAALVERVKPAQPNEKFKMYGKLKPAPPASRADQGNSLMAAYAAMSGQAPNYSTAQQAHVYAVAEAMLTWCKAEITLLSALKKELTPDAVAVDVTKSAERAAKLSERLPKMQQAEKQNSEAVRVKLVEVSNLIAADSNLLGTIKHTWRREIALITGTGADRVVHDESSITGDAWRAAAQQRDAREESIRREQEHLRHNPDDLPGLPTF